MTDRERQIEWHLDRRVSVSVILALVFQAAGGFWWASGITTRIEDHERRIISAEAREDVVQDELREQGRTVATLVERIENTNANIARLQSEVATTNQLLREIITGRGTP